MIFSLFSLFVSNNLNSEYFYFACYGLILTFGIIHGANDILLLLKGKEQTNKIIISSTLKYLLIVILISVLFFLFSEISLLFFILFSAYHFGEQQWTIFGSNKSKSISLFYFFYGLLIFSILFISVFSTSEKIEKCSESTGMKVVLLFFNSLLINDHPHTIASLFAIAINLVRLIILYVGNNPPIPEIALIT